MTDETLLAYLEDDRAALDRLAEADPALAERLATLNAIQEALLHPPDVSLPAGLVARTVSAVAAAAGPPTVPSSVARAGSGDGPLYTLRHRADVFVAAGIGFLAFGLGMGIVQKSRHEAAVRSCQNTLRELHASLDGYSQTHSGRYPQVGVPGAPTAGGFAARLTEAGYLMSESPVRCPAVDLADLGPAGRVGYTYALGYQAPGGALVGLRRPDPILGTEDRLVLGGDFPAVAVAPAGGPYSPHVRGQNVLFAGGHVAFTSSAGVGIDGDDIFRNAYGRVGAGLFPTDGCLGRPFDRP